MGVRAPEASQLTTARQGDAPAAAPDTSMLMRGLTLQGAGKPEEAAEVFRAYLEVVPHDGVAAYSLAVIHMQRGENELALELVSRVLAANDGFAPLWLAQGSLLQGQGRLAESLASYEKAIALNPQYTEALLNGGVVLREMHRHVEALERFQAVLKIKPDHETALGNAGILLTEFKRSEEAVAIFQRLLEVNPHYDWGVGLLAYERMHACDWTDFDANVSRMVKGLHEGQRTCKSLPLMAFTDDAAAHQISAQLFAARFPARAPMWNGERYRHRKIRVAYVSPDLREHPVGHLMCGIFERHDKGRFETIAISLGVDDKSRLRERMLACFDHFIDARGMPSSQIAKLMREMEVDIAVDLAGYTADSRTDVFAHRPAPVQVNYLGYPGTMGTSYMDYIIADRHIIPPEHRQYFNEKVVYLPDAYLPTDNSLRIAPETPSRAECGLPDDGVVFCSFSHDYKIAPPVFDVWMRLLAQVPGSVLWLMSRSEVSQKNLRREAERRGVDPARLVFARRVPRVEDHLARYRQADLFLDTHPYNAHTTAADAIMAGLPVVTFSGGAFPARVAASLLHAIDMPELVADSLAGYEALALRLAQDAGERQAVRARLAERRDRSALFDTDEFCRQLEAIYVSLWRESQLSNSHGPQLADETVQPLAEHFHVGTAESDIARGNLQRAELLCRDRLAESPRDVAALKLLGDIAAAIGAHDLAAQHYAEALAGMPAALAHRSSLMGLAAQASQRAAATSTMPADRFLLVKAWGYGFWSDLDHVAGALLLAEMTGRTPVVHWGHNSLFRNADTGNAFEAFFEPVSSVTRASLQRDGLRFYPEKWRADNLAREDVQKWEGQGARQSGLYLLRRTEEVVVSDFHIRLNDLIPWIPEGHALHGLNRSQLYRHLFKKYIHLKPALQQKIDRLAQDVLGTRPWLAVHVRGSDKVKEMSHLDIVNDAYWSAIAQILQVNPGLSIFLLTDSAPVVDAFRARYGDRVATLDCERSSNDTGVHYAGHNGIELGEQVVIDAWLAARCHFFLGNGGSNVSVGIRHLKDWDPGTFFLIGEDFLGQRNVSLHDW